MMDPIPGTARERALELPNLPHLAAISLGKSADTMAMLIGFHSTYKVPMAPLGSEDTRFEHVSDERVMLRFNLIAEEVAELRTKGLGIGDENDPIVDITLDDLAGAPRDGAEVADALGDIVYLCFGMALELGYDLRDVLKEIHAANLTKLGEDGQPILRDDGKVLKGPNYMPPNIPAVLGWEG